MKPNAERNEHEMELVGDEDGPARHIPFREKDPISPQIPQVRRLRTQSGENSSEGRTVREHSTGVSDAGGIVRPEQLRRNAPADRCAFRERLLEVVHEIGGEAELERRAGLPTATVTHYTRKQPSDPSRAYLVKIALAGGVSIAWLAAGIGPKKASE